MWLLTFVDIVSMYELCGVKLGFCGEVRWDGLRGGR